VRLNDAVRASCCESGTVSWKAIIVEIATRRWNPSSASETTLSEKPDHRHSNRCVNSSIVARL
jgi:hypothetical protein